MTQRILGLLLAISATIALAFGQGDGNRSDWKTVMDRGNERRVAGDFATSISAYLEALRIAEAANNARQIASAANMLGLNYDDMGRYLEAEKHYRRSLSIAEKEWGAKSPSVAQILVNYSNVFMHREEERKAESMLREALDIYSSAAVPDPMQLALTRSFLAEAMVQQGDLEKAEQLIEQATPVFAQDTDVSHGYLGMSFNNMGVIRKFQKRDREAVDLFERAIAALERNRGYDHPLLLYSLNNLGMEYMKLGRVSDADAAYKRGLQIAEKQLGPTHPLFAKLMQNYAGCLRKAGHKSEAKTLEARANSVLRENALVNGTGMTVSASAFRK